MFYTLNTNVLGHLDIWALYWCLFHENAVWIAGLERWVGIGDVKEGRLLIQQVVR